MPADERQLASSTHKQALSALVFLYTKVLQLGLPWVAQLERPRVRRRLPVMLGRDEVAVILARMKGKHALLARLPYGTGMRISEAWQLRVKDVDFSHQALILRDGKDGKGSKGRVLMLPQSLVKPLRDPLARQGCFGPRTLPTHTSASTCLVHCSAGIRVRAAHGRGSGCFRKRRIPPIPAVVSSLALRSTGRPRCS